MRLDSQTHIKRLQLLSHHFKIATKIDILTTNGGEFSMVGYVNLQSNSENGYKARELKSVHLDLVATKIRLVLYRCHVNSLNLYNQIGLVAVNILGVTDTIEATAANASNNLGYLNSQAYKGNAILGAEYEQLDQDKYLVSAMAKVQLEKIEAVKSENFAKAKQFKELENIFIKDATVINNLRANKARATRLEDYETAQGLQVIFIDKDELESIKTRLDEALRGAGIDISVRDPKQKVNTVSTIAFPAENLSHDIDDKPLEIKPKPMEIQSVAKAPIDAMEIPISTKNNNQNTESKQIDPMDRPIQAKTKKPLELDGKVLDTFPVKAMPKAKKEVPRPTSPTGSTSSEPVDIADDAVEEYTDAISIFGRQTVSHVAANAFNMREKGLQDVTDALKKFKAGDGDSVVSGTIQILKIIETDNREKCYNFYCSIFRMLAEHAKNNKLSSELIVEYCAASFSGLLNKLSDMSSRTRQNTDELLKYLVSCYHSEEENVLPLILRPASSKAATILAKHIFVRLVFCDQMVGSHKFTKSGWTKEMVEEFAAPYKDCPDIKVRNAALQLLKKLSSNQVDVKDSPMPEQRKEVKKPVAVEQPKTNKSKAEKSKPITMSDTACIFCGVDDPNFTEEALDVHYWKDCKVLTQCRMCQELVEVANLNRHLIRECKECLAHSTCKKCQMPVLTENMEQHQTDFVCRPVKEGVIRCPLCAQDIREPGTLSTHLATRPGCPEGRKFKKIPMVIKKDVKAE